MQESRAKTADALKEINEVSALTASKKASRDTCRNLRQNELTI
jgi:hypothetical protein